MLAENVRHRVRCSVNKNACVILNDAEPGLLLTNSAIITAMSEVNRQCERNTIMIFLALHSMYFVWTHYI